MTPLIFLISLTSMLVSGVSFYFWLKFIRKFRLSDLMIPGGKKGGLLKGVGFGLVGLLFVALPYLVMILGYGLILSFQLFSLNTKDELMTAYWIIFGVISFFNLIWSILTHLKFEDLFSRIHIHESKNFILLNSLIFAIIAGFGLERINGTDHNMATIIIWFAVYIGMMHFIKRLKHWS